MPLKYGMLTRNGSGSFATWLRLDASPACVFGVVVVGGAAQAAA
jgi:hypothetical protein